MANFLYQSSLFSKIKNQSLKVQHLFTYYVVPTSADRGADRIWSSPALRLTNAQSENANQEKN